MSTERTVPCTVAEVVTGNTLVLALRLGWRITLETRCELAGVMAAPPGTPEGDRAIEVLRAAVRSVESERAALAFTSHEYRHDVSIGQLHVTDAQGGRHDLAAALMDIG